MVRFTDNNNGTVTDTKTDLIWLKKASPCGKKNWKDSVLYCKSLASGTEGLTDGSTAGHWRLPTKKELEGIGTNQPVTWEAGFHSSTWKKPGSPFTVVQSSYYWSGTSYTGGTVNAWGMSMSQGYVLNSSKSTGYYVWPVRDGK